MHRYKTVAQISLIFSVLNLVLAAPVVVQGKYEASSNEMSVVVAEDPAPMPKNLNLKWRMLDAAPDGSTSTAPHMSPDTGASQGAVASPDDAAALSDGMGSPDAYRSGASMSPTYSTPPLSEHSSSGSSSHYMWLVDNPAPLSMRPPASLPVYDSAPPHRPSPGSVSPPSPPPEFEWNDVSIIYPSLRLPPTQTSPFALLPSGPRDPALSNILPPHPSILPEGPLPPPPLPQPSSSGTPGPSSRIPLSPELALTDTDSPLPPPPPPPTHTPPDNTELALTDTDSPLPPPPPPTTHTPPDNTEFNKKLMKKIGIVTGVLVVSGTLATLLGLQIKHHEQRDYQDN